MLNWFQVIWKLEPVPIIIAVALYFIVSFIRQWRPIAYTPLYFRIYPLSYIKSEVVNKYIGSKYYPPFLEDEDEAEKLRKKTLLIVSVSPILDTLLIPICIAFLWSLFLNIVQFTTALIIILFVQAIRFLASILTLKKHVYGTLKFRNWLIAWYTLALGFIALAMFETQQWVALSLARGNYLQLFSRIADLLWSLIPIAVFSVVLNAVIGIVLLDKKIRQHNLHEHQTPTSQKIITQRSHPKRPKRTNRK